MAAYEPDDFEDALALAAALRRRELSVLEVLEGTLQRIGERNGDLGAIVWLSEEDARARARRAQERLDADDPAPMLGVPLPVKDLHAVEGWPLTYGSWGGPHAPSTRSSLAVMALENAGFVLVGKTNTPELGELPATEGARLGPARNPWEKKKK
jgi:amidase